MMEVVQFQPEHLIIMRDQGIQPTQALIVGSLLADPAYAIALRDGGPSGTAVDGGRILGCAGVMKIWEGRGLAWSVLATDIGVHFVGFHRAVKYFIEHCELRRIEADVQADFPSAHRWMTLLGFEREASRRAYSPDGTDYDLYARVREGVANGANVSE